MTKTTQPRRGCLNPASALFALAACLLSTPAPAAPAPIELGLQAFTFRYHTLEETLDHAVALGIKNIQLYGAQTISSQVPEKATHNMSDAAKTALRALLATRNLTLTSYGVVRGKSEADWRKVFAFAKEMGLRDIAAEPNPKDLPLLAKLSDETGVKVAIHNHPPPSLYWDPDATLAAIAPYGKNIGLCADTGHWTRSNLDPVATLRKTASRIIQVHFNDTSTRGDKTAHDVPWGTGAADAPAQLRELLRQNYRGILYIEYEHTNIPPAQFDAELAASIAWFRKEIKN